MYGRKQNFVLEWSPSSTGNGQGQVEIQMPESDYERAIQYALNRLEAELSPDLYYHSLRHTRDDVMPATRRLAAMAGVSEVETRLLVVAAAFHDIGFTQKRQDHELVGIQIATQVLPKFGFERDHIAAINGMILATRLPQSPQNELEALLADADLDVLGREEDFFIRSNHLRQEWATIGDLVTDEEWYRSQLEFLHEHSYFTDVARTLREKGKYNNIAETKKLLALAQNNHGQKVR